MPLVVHPNPPSRIHHNSNSDHRKSNAIPTALPMRYKYIENNTHRHGSCLEYSFAVVDGVEDLICSRRVCGVSIHGISSEVTGRTLVGGPGSVSGFGFRFSVLGVLPVTSEDMPLN